MEILKTLLKVTLLLVGVLFMAVGLFFGVMCGVANEGRYIDLQGKIVGFFGFMGVALVGYFIVRGMARSLSGERSEGNKVEDQQKLGD